MELDSLLRVSLSSVHRLESYLKKISNVWSYTPACRLIKPPGDHYNREE